MMQDLAVFSIASQRTRWLATSGATIASNIANADTPGYTARDVTSFEAALTNSRLSMSQTAVGHMMPSATEMRAFETVPREAPDKKHSGNTVNIETEVMGLGEVRAQHMKVTGIVSAFNRMLMSVSKA